VEYHCSVCSQKVKGDVLVYFDHTEVHIFEQIKLQHPDWEENSGLCPKCEEFYRNQLKGRVPMAHKLNLMGKKYVTLFFFIVFVFLQLGFDYSKHSIPLDEIQSGGPPKDGIPALYDPKFISADEADFLKSSDRVLGLYINGEAKAYPIRILNWHELVNDRIGGQEVLVSYCPLCGTGMAFEAQIDGQRFLFGVSGKLYNSDVLFYDKETESLWSQIKMEAVTGPLTGKPLTLLPLVHTTWGAWRTKYPNTKVLSKKTGHFRDYGKNPYQSYETSELIMFPVKHKDKRLSRKAWVVGIVINAEAKAYSFERLQRDKKSIEDNVGGQMIIVEYDSHNQSAVIKDEQGNIVPSTQVYWFAWAAFYPNTKLYK